MLAVIGDILPLAVGVAISPVPMIAAILMLLSPRARGTSIGFLLGWVVGIVLAVVVFTLLSSILPEQESDESKPISGTIKILLGALLLLVALRQWRSRPVGDAEPVLPKWMGAIDSMTVTRALLLGVVLAAVNPKNLLLAASAGLAIGAADVSAGETAGVIAVFTLIAASTVAVPVIAYLLAARRMAAPLESLRRWLVQNNATVMAVLLLILGVVVIGKGIESF
jgi:threonine/homoserine/homoserine lactone efflux protein